MSPTSKEGCCTASAWRRVALFAFLLNLLLIVSLGLVAYFLQAAEARLQPELRVMLLGKNGAAKRALGNSILGRKAFPTKPDIAIIHRCKGINGRSQGNRNVTIFDSLEIHNTLDMAQRLNTCLHWVGPSPHVFLYIADPGERVCNGIHFIRESLGRAVTRFTIVVFTGVHTGNEKIIKPNLWQGVKCLVGGHHIFRGDFQGNSEQISVLMEKIDTLMRKHMGYKSVKKNT